MRSAAAPEPQKDSTDQGDPQERGGLRKAMEASGPRGHLPVQLWCLGAEPALSPSAPHSSGHRLSQCAVGPIVLPPPPLFFESCVLQNQLFLGSQNEKNAASARGRWHQWHIQFRRSHGKYYLRTDARASCGWKQCNQVPRSCSMLTFCLVISTKFT